MSEPLILGIESSCDETGVGIVRGNDLLANEVASSMEQHVRFGGVVPEVASRTHLEAIVPVLEKATATAGGGPVRARRHRRDGGSRSGRGVGRRSVGCQGAGKLAQQAALRRQPPDRARRRRPA